VSDPDRSVAPRFRDVDGEANGSPSADRNADDGFRLGDVHVKTPFSLGFENGGVRG
jgi:hypothetical protein